MLLSVVHSTRYRYATQVQRSTQYIRLTPWAGTQQRVIEWSVDLPAPCVTMRDAFDNLTHVLTLDRPHEELAMVARGRVEVADVDDGEPAGRVNPKVFLRATRLTEPDDDLRAFAEPMRGVVRNRPLIGLSDLMTAVLDRLPFRTGATAVDFTAAQSFAAGAGVAQDHTHVFLACCRLLGVPARYVSGYAYSPNREQVASHAWAEAWLGTRWVSFDVTHARQAGGGYIKLAIGLDYLDACPVRGVRLGGTGEELATKAQVSAGPAQA
jgi:transglutaminase-like putative cysteine protease